MIPAETKAGRSFKGAAAYYFHDKREQGANGPTGGKTADRVEWAETVNLATQDPERAWRMMAHTAMAQAEIKAAAGVKATGRKLQSPVYAYSLSWDPSDRPSRDEQRQAALETLKALGLEKHQAVIVAHNDEPHAHVHILVNRVNPETGVAATLSNSRLKLSEWALGYSKARGTDHLTPKREENHKRRKQGQKTEAKRKPRPQFEAERAVGNDNLKMEFVKTEQRSRDAALYRAGREMRSAHKKQWTGLERTYDTVRNRMMETTRRVKDQKVGEIKDRSKARWRNLFEQQREDRANFEAAERGILSKLWSMAFVYQAARRNTPQADVLTLFYTIASSSRRRAVFDHAQEVERRELAKQISREVDHARTQVDRTVAKDFVRLRDEYLAQTATLRTTHAAQQEVMYDQWQARNAERKAAFAPYRQQIDRTQRQGRGQQQGRSRSRSEDEAMQPPPQTWKGPGQGGPA